MISPVALVLLLAAQSPEQTTLPRHPDPDPVTQQSCAPAQATDPYFDREYVATDDPAFVLAAMENARQGLVDARSAAATTGNPELRAAAEKISAQNEATSRKLEKVAAAKGWRVPEPNPARSSSVNGSIDGNGKGGDSVRANANFIVHQISFHQSTRGAVPCADRRQGRRGPQTRVARSLAGLPEEPRTAADAQALSQCRCARWRVASADVR